MKENGAELVFPMCIARTRKNPVNARRALSWNNWINEKKTLERLIREGVSYERIGRQYGVSGTAVKKAAKKLGIELEQKREINPNEHFNKGKKRVVYYCLNCGKKLENKNVDFRIHLNMSRGEIATGSVAVNH